MHGTLEMDTTFKKEVQLIGQGEKHYWTRQALHRNRISINNEALLSIDCNISGGWQVINKNRSENCSSLEQVIELIKSENT